MKTHDHTLFVMFCTKSDKRTKTAMRATKSGPADRRSVNVIYTTRRGLRDIPARTRKITEPSMHIAEINC